MVGHIGSDSGNTKDAKVAYTYLEYDCGILVTITTTLPTTQAILERTNKLKHKGTYQTCDYSCRPAHTMRDKWALECPLLAF